jgi:hypothetical protein
MDKYGLRQALGKAEQPLGWYLAGLLADNFSRERFDFFKKSAEGGCSWGQVGYAWFFSSGMFVEKDMKTYVEWLERAAKQENPSAMEYLGQWFQKEGNDKKKAVAYFRQAAELDWKSSMGCLAKMLRVGEGCERDLRQAAIWSAKGNDVWVFWNVLDKARVDLKRAAPEKLDRDFNQLCYSLGWGLNWQMYGNVYWDGRSEEEKGFGNSCLDYYCSCLEQRQGPILTFLLCWNRTTGVKDVGQMIARLMWEGMERKPLPKFEARPEGIEGKREGKKGCILF